MHIRNLEFLIWNRFLQSLSALEVGLSSLVPKPCQARKPDLRSGLQDNPLASDREPPDAAGQAGAARPGLFRSMQPAPPGIILNGLHRPSGLNVFRRATM